MRQDSLILVVDFVDWYYDHALANADFISVIKFPNKSYCLASVAFARNPQTRPPPQWCQISNLIILFAIKLLCQGWNPEYTLQSQQRHYIKPFYLYKPTLKMKSHKWNFAWVLYLACSQRIQFHFQKNKGVEPKIWLKWSQHLIYPHATFRKDYCIIALLTLGHFFLCGYELRSMSTSKIII